MAITLVQTATASTYKRGRGSRGSVTLRASFTAPTTAGSYVLAVVTGTGGEELDYDLSDSSFSRLVDDGSGDLQLTIWGKANCPAITSLTVYMDSYRGATLRLLEYSGVRTSSAVDKTVLNSGYSSSPSSGYTGTTAQADELVFGVIANQYLSSQGGFTGGLAKIYEDVVPDGDTDDWERGRTTFHQLVTTATNTFRLGASLSTSRRWFASLITLKGGTTGPAPLYSTTQPALYTAGGKTGSKLIVFGRFISMDQPAAYETLASSRARIGPSDDQYRLGGWSGLTIGQGTDFVIESVDGLEGWEARTSDDELPREDGALRGVDLQTARNVGFKVNFTGSREQIELRKVELMRYLVLQRTDDWELLFRLPGEELKSVYVRPTALLRTIDPLQIFLHTQAFVLRAADPRHYSATIQNLTVPVTTDRSDPDLVEAVNMGSGYAYPVIRINGPVSGSATRVTLTNVTSHDTFDVVAVLGSGQELVGDMRSRVAGLAVSPVTIDGVTKYGAWQPPRVPFSILPGINYLMFEVEPADAAVTCSVEFRSTWSG